MKPKIKKHIKDIVEVCFRAVRGLFRFLIALVVTHYFVVHLPEYRNYNVESNVAIFYVVVALMWLVSNVVIGWVRREE